MHENQAHLNILGRIRNPKKKKVQPAATGSEWKSSREYVGTPAKALIVASLNGDVIAPSPISSGGKKHLAARMRSIHANPERKAAAFKIGGPKADAERQVMEPQRQVEDVSVTPVAVKSKPAAVGERRNVLKKLLGSAFQ